MDNYKIRIVEDVPIPESGLAVKFLSDDIEEAKAWAREHASAGWDIQGGHNDQVYTLVFTHKEGDTATFPFTYIWDGEKIVKEYVTQEDGEK